MAKMLVKILTKVAEFATTACQDCTHKDIKINILLEYNFMVEYCKNKA